MARKMFGWWNQNTRTNVLCILAALISYTSVYGFRKPLSAAMFADDELWGIDFKIIAITVQIIGYICSKFWGITAISGMNPKQRLIRIFQFLGLSWFGLLLFALLPQPYNLLGLFINGLPLGMMWGVIFSFLEGRKSTELLGTSMCITFIVSSGFTKTVGKALIEYVGVSEWWMPCVAGLFFIPMLIVGVWLLKLIPPPTAEDIADRSERTPMSKQDRSVFLKDFGVGILFSTILFAALTTFRDLRDSFAVELWSELGYSGDVSILSTAEIPIAFIVLIAIAGMIRIHNHQKAFFLNILLFFIGGILLVASTWLFSNGSISPIIWMIVSGTGLYIAYICFHAVYMERWIALFRVKGNIGFLMYIVDSFGYLSSVSVLFYKNFGSSTNSWLDFTKQSAYIMGGIILIMSISLLFYFKLKLSASEKKVGSVALDIEPVVATTN